MIKKLIIKILAKSLKLHPSALGHLKNSFSNDFSKEDRISLLQKLKAYRNGFTGSEFVEYDLKTNNSKNYISEYEYYKLFPLNSKFSMWIDDKLTLKYTLSKYNEFLPQYYFSIDKGEILPSIDSSLNTRYTAESVITLLKDKKKLALKQESGALGKGFYKLEFRNNEFYLSGEPTSENRIKKLLNSLDGYLITEFIVAHKKIDKIFPGVANSMRLMVIKDGNEPAILANAFIRFGTEKTGGIDNASAGGMLSIVDVEDGYFEGGYQMTDGKLSSFESHPDTGVAFKGHIPHWDLIKEKILEMTDYLGHISWQGYDVVVTENSFKILEINSHQDVSWYQYFYPLLINNPASEFLNKKLKEKGLR